MENIGAISLVVPARVNVDMDLLEWSIFGPQETTVPQGASLTIVDDFESATELNLKLWVDGPHRTPKQVDVTVRQRVYDMQMKAFQADIPDDVDDIDIDPPALGRLGQVETPTLILVGALDLDEKLEMADQMVSEMINAQKMIIDDVAHMLNMEKPAEFNQLVLDFLAE